MIVGCGRTLPVSPPHGCDPFSECFRSTCHIAQTGWKGKVRRERECLHTQAQSRLSVAWWVAAGASFDLGNQCSSPKSPGS